jgi:tagatose-6-phosphate ketose/aldose isomerase
MAREFTGLANTHCIVLDDRVNDRGLAMTSSFTNMVIAGQSLAHLEDLSSYEPVLEDLIKASERFLPTAADVAAELAAGHFPKVCFLGTGSLKAVAIESALKLTELTAGRILTWSESYLGVRHGPLSAVDSETLVIGFLSGNERRRFYELDLLREVQLKELSGKLVAIGPLNSLKDCPVDLSLALPFADQLNDFYRPPADVIFGQLFGLFSSIKAGLQPDTPSPKGAISRVVTQVKVY